MALLLLRWLSWGLWLQLSLINTGLCSWKGKKVSGSGSHHFWWCEAVVHSTNISTFVVIDLTLCKFLWCNYVLVCHTMHTIKHWHNTPFNDILVSMQSKHGVHFDWPIFFWCAVSHKKDLLWVNSPTNREDGRRECIIKSWRNFKKPVGSLVELGAEYRFHQGSKRLPQWFLGRDDGTTLETGNPNGHLC